MSIYKKLIFSFALVLFVFSLLLAVVSSTYSVNELSNERKKLILESVVSSVEENKFIFFASDSTDIKNWLNSVVQKSGVAYASILDANKNVLFSVSSQDSGINNPIHRQNTFFNPSKYISVLEKIELNDAAINENRYFHLLIESNRRNILKKVLFAVLTILSFLAVLIWPLLILVSKWVSRPIEKLSNQVQLISPENIGDEYIFPSKNAPSEIEVFASHFNHLLTRLLDYMQNLDSKVEERTTMLNQAMYVAQENEKQKQTIFAHLSHDLKTPLSSMRGYLDIIQEQLSMANYDMAKNNIPKAINCSEIMLNEIEELLRISTETHIDNLLVAEKIDLKEACKSIIDKHSSLSDQSNNTVLFNYAGNTHPVINHCITLHVLDNLISNSNKYSKNGTITISVNVSDNAIISVSDTGKGVEKSEIDSLFEPPESTSHLLSGWGLFLCKERLGMIGGKICVKNQTSTEFTIQYSVPVTE